MAPQDQGPEGSPSPEFSLLIATVALSGYYQLYIHQIENHQALFSSSRFSKEPGRNMLLL